MNKRALMTVPAVLAASLVLASCGTAAAPEPTASFTAVVEAPIEVEVDERTPQEQLTDAVKEDDLVLAESAIAAGADVNDVMDNGNSPLSIAVTRDNIEMVELLLAYDPVLADEETGWTMLEVAANFAGPDVTQALLDAGLHPDGIEPALGAPLAAAVFVANNGAAQVLIDAGADVNIILPPPAPGMDDFTPIFPAAFGGDVDTIRLLVEAGADITHKNSDGYTALDWAGTAGNQDVVNYLTEIGG